MYLNRKYIGNVHVESGRLLLIDPCNLKNWQPGIYDPTFPLPLNHYDEAQKLADTEPWHGRMFDDCAVVVTPADGAGPYPVYAYFTEDGLLVKVAVVMGVEAVEEIDEPAWRSTHDDFMFESQADMEALYSDYDTQN